MHINDTPTPLQTAVQQGGISKPFVLCANFYSRARTLFKAGQRILSAISIAVLGISMSACSKTITWKEEVLLHDGTRMMVSRSQTHSGAGEIGQGQPITAISITFTPTKADRPITWELGESTIRAGQVDLDLLGLDIVQGTPYIVTSPVGCLVYGQLGKPNPPYLFFKYVGQQWHQIPLQEFPAEIAKPNVRISIYSIEEIKRIEEQWGFVTAASTQLDNLGLQQAELKFIHRKPIVPTGRSASLVDCPIPTGPDGLPIPAGSKGDKQ
ncbi:MAG: hypothetical protein CFE43_08160 [Burkholderiales bacterium PBB3]|nr:MAG: hypothetical protein CFE43_08160 [Burkholderiales bacterium PBB3]